MDDVRFDRLAKHFGTTSTRRLLVKLLGGGVAGGLLAAVGVSQVTADRKNAAGRKKVTVDRKNADCAKPGQKPKDKKPCCDGSPDPATGRCPEAPTGECVTDADCEDGFLVTTNRCIDDACVTTFPTCGAPDFSCCQSAPGSSIGPCSESSCEGHLERLCPRLPEHGGGWFCCLELEVCNLEKGRCEPPPCQTFAEYGQPCDLLQGQCCNCAGKQAEGCNCWDGGFDPVYKGYCSPAPEGA